MAEEILNMQRTFPKKTIFNNNSKSKKGKWKRGREMEKRKEENYIPSNFNENDCNCDNDEIEMKLEQQSKDKKTKKAQKQAAYVAKKTKKQSDESLNAEEFGKKNISAENDETMTRTSDDNDQLRSRKRLLEGNRLNDRKKRVSSISDEVKNSTSSTSNVRKSEMETKDDKFSSTSSVAQELDRHSSDAKEVALMEPRKPIQNLITSLAEEHEEANLDNTEFREEIAKIPLGKAKQLQERIGKKLFDRAFFVDDSSSSLNNKSARRAFRENPKRPREVSSKIPVSKFRNVFENEKLERPIFDPRFDSRCGEFNDYIYHNNYSFLDEIRQREKKILIEELKNATEEGNVNRNRLKEALRKMKNQEKTRADVNRRKEIIRELRHENNERMRQGLPPIFKTRAQIRELIWRKKYDDLKGGKKLEKYLRRKTKKQDKKYDVSTSVSHENEVISLSSD
uniref:rRNA biogenesis protein RRP36 n=1 Tax=Loa loa TaxID=7209 RepID=A0A1I7VGM1_LOALO